MQWYTHALTDEDIYSYNIYLLCLYSTWQVMCACLYKAGFHIHTPCLCFTSMEISIPMSMSISIACLAIYA